MNSDNVHETATNPSEKIFFFFPFFFLFFGS
jgi:hypothetical protein